MSKKPSKKKAAGEKAYGKTKLAAEMKKLREPLPKPAENDERIIRIPVQNIKPSHLNCQRDENEPGIQTLAESMRSDGLIQPIVVRPVLDQERPYEIVCGERRWVAAKRLGWESIPAIIRDIDLHEAHVQRLVENLQRLDVPPLEQAAGIAVLLGRYKDPAEVGRRIGQTEQWVRLRTRLCNLSERWRAELSTSDTDYDRLGMFVGWQEHLAKLPIETQDLLWQKRALVAARTERDLCCFIGQFLRRIDDAPWTAEVERSLPKSERCQQCEKRSDYEATLFKDLLQENEPGAVCLDPQCWDRKVDLWLRGLIRKERKDHPDLVLLISEYCVSDEMRKELPDGLRVCTRQHWNEENEPGLLKSTGLFLTGKRRGEIADVYVTKDSGDEVMSGVVLPAGPDADDQKREQEDLDQKKESLQDKIDSPSWPGEALRARPILAAIMFGLDSEWADKPPIDSILALSLDDAARIFWQRIAHQLTDRINFIFDGEELASIATAAGLQIE